MKKTYTMPTIKAKKIKCGTILTGSTLSIESVTEGDGDWGAAQSKDTALSLDFLNDLDQ